MFDTFRNLPLHALVVHAAVVLIPLEAFLGVLFVVPRLRAWSRWPLALVAIAATVTAWVATQSGQELRDALGLQDPAANEVAAQVARHADLGDQLVIFVVVYSVIALIAVYLMGRRPGSGPPDPEGGTDRGRRQPVAVGLSVLLVLGALAVGIQSFRVGDAGAKAVWNPTGQVDYSTD
ncbi:MAG: DUF2231 domain-containing protein [Jiangellaceae bacterium]